jgi:hypothetical protein
MTRRQLPNRRSALNFELEVAGLRYTCTVGRYDDGKVGEVFLSNHKSNSSADTAARDRAIVCSIALQCGADLESIRRALCSARRTAAPKGTFRAYSVKRLSRAFS